MNKTLRTTIVIILAVIVFLFALLLILPYAFRGKIIDFAKKEVNEMLNAEVDFDKLSLSFIRDFPRATVGLKNLTVTGIDEFANDTLLHSEEIRVVVNLKSIFGDAGYEIYEVGLYDTDINAKVLQSGKANWDIVKETGEEEIIEEVTTEESSSDLNLKLHDLNVKNANITYIDEESNMVVYVKGFNHHTSGDLSLSTSLLETNTLIDALTFKMDGVDYVSKAEVELNVDIDADLDNMRFTLSKNHSRINAISFSLDGWLAVLDEGLDMDIKLLADDVDFKSILSMIPAVYAKEFTGLKADGNVDLNAYVKGQMIDEQYPAFDIKLVVENGWMQYPDLPKSLNNINISANVKSPGGDLDNMTVDVSRFSFNLGGNPFSANLSLKHVMSDPDFSASADGKLDLGMIKDFYPLEDGTQLNGLLTVNLGASGKMSYYEKEQYDKFRFKGSLNLNNMMVAVSGLSQDVSIQHAELNFNDRYVDVPSFKVNIGRNDISLSGKLENFIAYAFYDQTIKGQLNLSSGYLNLNDFMSGEEAATEAATEETPLSVIEIPKNIDFTLQAQFKELIYDKMQFANAKGVLKVKDGNVNIQNMAVDAFGGDMNVNGMYSTANPKEPKLNMDLKINEVEFTSIFSQVGLLQSFAPVLEHAKGRFSTTLSFNTLLGQDMSPDLSSFSANGRLSTKSVGLTGVPALTALANGLKQPELASPTLKNLALKFKINDGKLETEPFDMQVANVKMNLGGYTTLDKKLSYSGKVQLPDNLNLGRLSTVGFTIGGTFSSPKVNVNVEDIVSDIVDDAKEQLKQEVTQKVEEVKEKVDAELQKKKEEALKAAQEQAVRIQAEAQKAGEKLVAEAEKQGNELISKTNNAIAKKAAEVTAKKLVDEAQKQANELNRIAKDESDKLIKAAENL